MLGVKVKIFMFKDENHGSEIISDFLKDKDFIDIKLETFPQQNSFGLVYMSRAVVIYK